MIFKHCQNIFDLFNQPLWWGFCLSKHDCDMLYINLGNVQDPSPLLGSHVCRRQKLYPPGFRILLTAGALFLFSLSISFYCDLLSISVFVILLVLPGFVYVLSARCSKDIRSILVLWNYSCSRKKNDDSYMLSLHAEWLKIKGDNSNNIDLT